MKYLHRCEIGVHGNLNSCTCVIDSRFVLKVTGFGHRSLQAQCNKNFKSDSEFYISMYKII